MSFGYRRVVSVLISSTIVAGCRFGGATGPKSGRSASLEMEVEQADRYTHESRTLSNLAVLEKGMDDYIKTEGKIPDTFETLIPKYVAEIPAVESGVRGHADTAEVRDYGPEVIRDGVIDGTQLRDSGRWGYAHNDRQVIIFVDCTHLNSRGKPWYRERGVF